MQCPECGGTWVFYNEGHDPGDTPCLRNQVRKLCKRVKELEEKVEQIMPTLN